MKIQLLFRPPDNRTEDHWLKLWSYYKSREQDSTVVDLYVFRLIPYLAAASMLGYLAMALVLFVWISRKPQKDVGYLDVLVMPFNWEAFEQKRGRLYIESGEQDIQAQKFQEGVMKIRMGLKKYPQDRKSRIFLAQIYYAAGLVKPAHDLMLEGIELGMIDTEFLSSFFRICHESEAFESVLKASERALEDETFSADRHNVYFITRYKISALIEMGRSEEAYELAHAVNSDPEGTRRMVDAEFLALIKLGRPVEALIVLEKWRFRMGSGNLQLQNLFIDAYIELDDQRNLVKAVEELINFDRLNPNLLILAMKKWHLAENREKLEEVFIKYMLIFGWDPVNLAKVNNFVTSIREVELVEEVLRMTRTRGLDEEVILFNLFYAYLMDGRWDEADGVLDQLNASIEKFSPIDQKLVGIGETIIRLKKGQQDNLRLLLLQELRRIRASIPFYMTVSQILKETELFDVALDTLEQGLAIFPFSKQIEDAYREATQSAVQYAKDNTVIETAEVLELNPDEYLTQLDQLLSSKQFDSAEDLLTQIYRVGAPWLTGRGEDFQYRKLQLYFETRDSFLLSQSTTLFLNDNPESGPELMQLALSYLNKGETERSRILAQEIVRANPQNKEARKLLAELGESAKTTSKNPNDNTQKVERSFQSKTKLIAELESGLETKEWATVEKLIQGTLRANPVWLSRDRQTFDILHIRYYLESGNRSSASSLIRIYMGSDAQSARNLLDLAKEYETREMKEESNFLAEQVERKFPNMK